MEKYICLHAAAKICNTKAVRDTDDSWGNGYDTCATTIRKAIENLPAADVVEIKPLSQMLATIAPPPYYNKASPEAWESFLKGWAKAQK